MKTIQLTTVLLFCPLLFFAQTLTGLWMGSVHNDSTTIRKDASFEIVLTQYKDKVYGYSRSTFTVHDTLFYIVKRVKGTIDGDVCEVKDDEIVSYNFQGRLDKGVKMVSTFRFDHNDSVWRMDGDWKTNKTKKYYSVSGKIALAQEKDLAKSRIFPHLEELKLAGDVSFYNDYKQASEPPPAPKRDLIASNTHPVNTTIRDNKTSDLQSKPTAQPQKTIVTTQHPVAAASDEKKSNTDVAMISRPASDQPPARQESAPSIVQQQPVALKSVNSEAPKTPTQPQPTDTKSTANHKPSATTAEPVAENKKTVVKQEVASNGPVVSGTPIEQKPEKGNATSNSNPPSQSTAMTQSNSVPVSTMFSGSKPAVTGNAALFVAERTVKAPEVVNFVSDSLELALYDNGEVDGDTVSVLLNGEIILARQGLKASAIKKMIYVPAGQDDSMTLVLYAENLGKYPPNTGLLIVHDGDETYQIRFSADLTQNAAVIFKRKRK